VTDAGEPDPGDYALAVGKSVAAAGAAELDIPIVLVNGDSLGGIQFRLRFDGAVLDSVLGLDVDPASRLFVGAGSDSVIGSSFAQPTDSTLLVVTVDLRPGAGGDPYESIRPIPPGNDHLFSVRVRLKDAFPLLPDTVEVAPDEVFFSTPSGSSDVVVADLTTGLLIVTE